MTSDFQSSHLVQQEIIMALFFPPLPCHWQSALTLGHMISPVSQCVNDISLVRYGFVGCRFQCASNPSRANNVQCAVVWQVMVVRVIICCLWTDEHAGKYLNITVSAQINYSLTC